MNSDQLRQFKVIAETGSITKASEILYITQPALSMALSRLEEELARPLFIRKGRSLEITDDGRKLLYYANIVSNAIDDAQDYFRIQSYSNYIKIYRIGGSSIPLLTEGCYDMQDYRINCVLIKNSELPTIVGSGIADIVIADEKYMNLAMHKYVEWKPLYHQQLILSVDENDPLAERDTIDVSELKNITLVGRTSPLGFNDWITEIKKENGCDFSDEILIDNITYFAERDKLPWPYLMGSFGIGTTKGKEHFAHRKSIRVTGKYTERDICVYWNRRNRKDMKALIKKIEDNAKKVNALDKEINYRY